MTELSDDAVWAPFGEARWRELAEGTGASELQLKFAAARFSGASASAAARIAGYAGDAAALRRAGYAALRSTAVQNLLELAAINAPADAKISDKEIEAKIAKLIRSADSNVSLKAMEQHSKREAAHKEAAQESPDINVWDECSAMCTDMPMSGVGAGLAMGVWVNGGGNLINFPLISEAAPIVSKKWPEDWARWLEKHSERSRQFLNEMAAGPLLEGDALVAACRAKRAKRGPIAAKAEVGADNAS
jgi:hypothetical protein